VLIKLRAPRCSKQPACDDMPALAGNTLLRALKSVHATVAHRCMTVCCSAAAVGAARMLQLDADGIHDRAYRLRYNEGQNRTDRFSTVRYLD